MRKALREANKNNGKKDTKRKKKSKVSFKKINLNKKTKIVLIFLVVFVLLVILMKNYTTFGLVVNKNITSKDVIQVELKSSNNNIFPYKNNVLVYENGTLLCYNKHGKLKWETIIEDTLYADINVAGDFIQVINKDKNTIYIFKNRYEISRIKLKENLSSGSITKDGISLIEYNYLGSKKAIAIYDKYGRQKYDVKLNNSIIGKSVLSNDGRYLAYIDVDISGISTYSKVNIIDLKNIDESDLNYVTAYSENNKLVYDIYWYGKKLVIRTEDELKLYNLTNKELISNDITSGSYENIGLEKLNYAYVSQDEKGTHYLTLSKLLSKNNKSIEIEELPKYFVYTNGLAYICYSKKIEIYNGFGMKIKNYDSDFVITKPVIFNEGTGVAFIVSNKLILFNI